MKRFDLLAAAVLAVGGIGLAASPVFAEDQPAGGQPAGQQQQAQPSPAQPSAAQPAGDRYGGAQAAGDRSASGQQASDSDIRQALSQVAQAVLTKGGISNLSQQFAQKDQDRLKDLSKETAQLDQTIDQLRQAYKDKYQKDLDLSASADQVFTSEFFRIGGAGEGARQASERISSDQNSSNVGAGAAAGGAGGAGAAAGGAGAGASAGTGAGTGAAGSSTGANQPAGTSGTSGMAGTAGTASGQSGGAAASGGYGAQTASSSSGAMTSVTIPASHEMPEVRLNLIKEGGSWKIDVPDSVDGQKLSQNLQQQLQNCVQMKDKWPGEANEASRAISHSVFVALAGESGGAGRTSGASGASGATGAGTETGSTPTPAAGKQ